MRFYNCTLDSVLSTYTRTFFALLNSLFQIKADEMLESIATQQAVHSEDGRVIIDQLKKQSKGLNGLVNEVKVVKGIKQK